MSMDFIMGKMDHAVEYGVNESIIINCLRFWIEHNKANGSNNYDGRTWTYNSADAWSKMLPCFSKSQITRILNKLKENGVILTANYNSMKYDRTLWYAFSDECKFLNCEIHLSDSSNGGDGNVPPIPDITNVKPKQTHRYSDEFENVWNAYTKKGNKVKAYAQWKKLTDEDKAEIIELVPKMVLCFERNYLNGFESLINPTSEIWKSKALDVEERLAKQQPQQDDYTNLFAQMNEQKRGLI